MGRLGALARMEGHRLDAPLGLGERTSRAAFGDLVEKHGLGRALGAYTREVVAAMVPRHHRCCFDVSHPPHDTLAP